MQGGENDQHVVAGPRPRRNVGDRQQHQPRTQEINAAPTHGLDEGVEGAEGRVVEKAPQQGGDDAGNGVGHKEGHAEEVLEAHHRRIQQQGQDEG